MNNDSCFLLTSLFIFVFRFADCRNPLRALRRVINPQHWDVSRISFSSLGRPLKAKGRVWRRFVIYPMSEARLFLWNVEMSPERYFYAYSAYDFFLTSLGDHLATGCSTGSGDGKKRYSGQCWNASQTVGLSLDPLSIPMGRPKFLLMQKEGGTFALALPPLQKNLNGYNFMCWNSTWEQGA